MNQPANQQICDPPEKKKWNLNISPQQKNQSIWRKNPWVRFRFGNLFCCLTKIPFKVGPYNRLQVELWGPYKQGFSTPVTQLLYKAIYRGPISPYCPTTGSGAHLVQPKRSTTARVNFDKNEYVRFRLAGVRIPWTGGQAKRKSEGRFGIQIGRCFGSWMVMVNDLCFLGVIKEYSNFE